MKNRPLHIRDVALNNVLTIKVNHIFFKNSHFPKYQITVSVLPIRFLKRIIEFIILHPNSITQFKTLWRKKYAGQH